MKPKPGRDGQDDYFVCAHCGTEVRPDAKVCPECGSDDQTGWSEDADQWAVDIPAGYALDDEFDYEEFVQREFGGRSARPTLRRMLVAAVALLLGLALVIAGLYLLR